MKMISETQTLKFHFQPICCMGCLLNVLQLNSLIVTEQITWVTPCCAKCLISGF